MKQIKQLSRSNQDVCTIKKIANISLISQFFWSPGSPERTIPGVRGWCGVIVVVVVVWGCWRKNNNKKGDEKEEEGAAVTTQVRQVVWWEGEGRSGRVFDTRIWCRPGSGSGSDKVSWTLIGFCSDYYGFGKFRIYSHFIALIHNSSHHGALLQQFSRAGLLISV